MKNFELLVESTMLDLNLNKFFEKATENLDGITAERVKDFTKDKRVFNIKQGENVIAHVIKKKHFVKTKFVMKPEDPNLKIKPIILPYESGFKIKFNRLTPVVNDFTNFISKCTK